MRRDAILQVVEPGRHPEHVLLGGVSIAAGLAATLRRTIPAVRAVACGNRLAADRAAAGGHVGSCVS